MLIHKTGDILKATENIIFHQVNVQGVMGGGLALQIANLYPECEKEYKKMCDYYDNDYEQLKGKAYRYCIDDNQEIANCFTQKPNFDTDYVELEKCVWAILSYAKICKKTVAVPYKYGCGIAHGDWNKVSKIFADSSDEYGVDISVYSWENRK